jgi:hypothetical protein
MAIPVVELIFDQDCPNVPATRATLSHALSSLALPARWYEWDRADPASPDYARQYGSPTVLVNGRDVAGEAPSHAPCCRVYTDVAGRNRGVPPLELIVAALSASRSR